MELRQIRGGWDAFWREDESQAKKEAENNVWILGWRSSTYGYCVFLEKC
jgi:hypothetical protein